MVNHWFAFLPHVGRQTALLEKLERSRNLITQYVELLRCEGEELLRVESECEVVALRSWTPDEILRAKAASMAEVTRDESGVSF